MIGYYLYHLRFSLTCQSDIDIFNFHISFKRAAYKVTLIYFTGKFWKELGPSLYICNKRLNKIFLCCLKKNNNLLVNINVVTFNQIGYIGFLWFAYFVVYLFMYIDFYMYAPSQDLDFQRNMLSSFLCSVSRSERWLFVLLVLVELLTITV